MVGGKNSSDGFGIGGRKFGTGYGSTKLTDWDRRFIDLAAHVATWSRDPSTKTGAVIVNPKNRHVVSLGYNGFPAGMPDDPELYADREAKLSRIVHCEINALIHANGNVVGDTLYTSPFISCDRCFVVMANAGILRFVAPKPNEIQAARWGESFEKVRRYAKEMGIEVVEL